MDEEVGRRYYLEATPKRVGDVRLPDGRVRQAAGLETPIESEDEQFYYIRVYEMATPQPPVVDVAKEAAIRESYRFELVEENRLTLEPFSRGLPQQGQWRDGFAVGDLNGDGNLDLIHGPARKGRRKPNVFLGDGRGGWTPWEITVPPLPYDYGAVAVADFDGDSRLDIALAMHLSGMVVLVQRAAGVFEDWSEGLYLRGRPGIDPATTFSSRTVVATDWNGDGRPDLASLGEGPALSIDRPGEAPLPASHDVVVYLNGGDGTWRQLRETPPRATHGNGLASADVDGDGRLDLLLASSVMGHSLLLRLGSEDGRWEAAEVPGRSRMLVGAVAVDDLDGDGVPEMLLGYMARDLGAWRTGVDILRRGPAGWERRPLFNEATRENVTALAVGDLNGDGARDVVALSAEGRRWVFVGKGQGSFALELSPELPVEEGCHGFHAVLADLDGDGRDEIVEAFAGEPDAVFAPLDCTDNGGLGAWRAEPGPPAVDSRAAN